jgi:histidyl-tRNA synthetase
MSIAPACIIIDKLDKLDTSQVLKELEAEVGPDAARALSQTIMATEANEQILASIQREDFSHLAKISSAVRSLIPEADIVLTPNLMRGMGYYTGTVFEFRHPALSGSLGGGGRYDRLTEKFGGQPIAACGGSIGFERLMLVLEEQQKAQETGAVDAVVTTFSEDLRSQSLVVAATLRFRGLTVDVYPGDGKLKNQFKYADQKKPALR